MRARIGSVRVLERSRVPLRVLGVGGEDDDGAGEDAAVEENGDELERESVRMRLNE
jgi:hypothetical protein